MTSNLLDPLAAFGGTSGAARGIGTSSDVIRTLTDGTDLNAVWDEFLASIAALNSSRTGLLSMLSFPTPKHSELVAQANGRDDFEVASEFGVPKSLRAAPDTIRLGYTFEWYDVATRYTWKFLLDASVNQVEAAHAMVLEADNRNVWRSIMRSLFVPSATAINEDGTHVFGLWSADGMAPPRYLDRTFDGTHTHYLCSGSAVLDGLDVEVLLDTITEHGYGARPGDQLVLFVNPAEGKVLRRFKAGQAAPGGTTSFDFINGQAAPAYLTDQVIVGKQAPTAYAGLPLIGSIGPAYVCELAQIPPGYIMAAATSGADNPANVVGYRQSDRTELQGLRIIPGNQSGYPLQEATYSHGFGTGVRNRGAAAIMQVTPGTTYVPPVVLA